MVGFVVVLFTIILTGAYTEVATTIRISTTLIVTRLRKWYSFRGSSSNDNHNVNHHHHHRFHKEGNSEQICGAVATLIWNGRMVTVAFVVVAAAVAVTVAVAVAVAAAVAAGAAGQEEQG